MNSPTETLLPRHESRRQRNYVHLLHIYLLGLSRPYLYVNNHVHEERCRDICVLRLFNAPSFVLVDGVLVPRSHDIDAEHR